eukprot:6461751-Pyramimonas_sp.AAC.1
MNTGGREFLSSGGATYKPCCRATCNRIKTTITQRPSRDVRCGAVAHRTPPLLHGGPWSGLWKVSIREEQVRQQNSLE